MPIIQLEPDPELTDLLFRTRRQTTFWYLLSKPVVAAAALGAVVLAISLWLAMGSSSRIPAHNHLTPLAHPTAAPTVPQGLASTPPRTAPRSPRSSPARVALTPTTSPGFAYRVTVHCVSLVTLVVTGTGIGTNTLRVTGPSTTRGVSGYEIVLSVTGPEGTYTLIDTDSAGHPGLFWASHGTTCYS